MNHTKQRAPKGRDRDRADRRAVADVLLARLHRGALSPAEGTLLAEHMREEQRVADESRRAMAGTTQALERHRAAADAEIRRLEGERDSLARSVEAMHDGINAAAREAFAQRRQHRDALAEQRAAVDRVLALVGRHDVIPADAVSAAIDADPAEHRTADDRARRWKDDQASDRAAVSRVRVLARTMRAGSPMGAAAIYAERIEQALANDRRALDPDTEVRARFLDAADSTEARLAEQKRDHDIALATVKQNADRHYADHRAACRTIAEMHQAATGRTGMGPIRGVVEDVADVRARAEKAEKALAAMEADRNRHQKYAVKASQRLAAADQRARLADDRAIKAERAAAHTAQVETGRAMWKSKAEQIEGRLAAAEQTIADIRTPQPIGRDHPMYALFAAMVGPSISRGEARQHIADYFNAITGRKG
ncbi:hypothetical protein [Streptomyces sp. NPDC017520]|uniref:hypothetical protein n=1 Tax=Streptomyces sp. NPDC017520 TaxID=3364998 RepID=UPI00378AA6CB